VDLYIAKLRMTYEYKDRKQLHDQVMTEAERELELTRTIANLKEELQMMQN
jgi:adenylate kinase family enzyme